MKRFTSKKNEVYLSESNTIIKIFSSPSAMEKELAVYRKIAGKLETPAVISREGAIVELEYIEGKTMLDVLIAGEKNGEMVEKPFQLMIAWINKFHEITQQRLRDVNFRNFIFCENAIYGIDFEDVCEGEAAEDLGGVLAYLLTYDPVLTDYKKTLARQLFSGMKEKEKVDAAMQSMLKRISQRRNLVLPEIILW